MSKPPSSSYLIEIIRLGNYAKASAVDPITGTEASIIGPINTLDKELERLAVQKLEYVLSKESSSD